MLFFGEVMSNCDIEMQLMDLVKVACRAFGGVYFLLPLILGLLPSLVMKECDKYMVLYAIAMAVYLYFPTSTKISKFMAVPKKIAYAVFFANACCTGVIQGRQAFPESNTAPVVLGFLAVTGGLMLENGVKGRFWEREYTDDQILGLLGPLLFLFCTGFFVADVKVDEDIARAVVCLFRLSCLWLDYNAVLNYLNTIRIQILKNISGKKKA